MRTTDDSSITFQKVFLVHKIYIIIVYNLKYCWRKYFLSRKKWIQLNICLISSMSSWRIDEIWERKNIQYRQKVGTKKMLTTSCVYSSSHHEYPMGWIIMIYLLNYESVQNYLSLLSYLQLALSVYGSHNITLGTEWRRLIETMKRHGTNL